jgi:hypothetical protein
MASAGILYRIVGISAAILLYLISAHKYDTIYLKKNRTNNILSLFTEEPIKQP